VGSVAGKGGWVALRTPNGASLRERLRAGGYPGDGRAGAKRADVARSKIRIVAGARSGDKVVEIEGTVPRDLDCPPPENRPAKRPEGMT
jgi:hypothetical protein